MHFVALSLLDSWSNWNLKNVRFGEEGNRSTRRKQKQMYTTIKLSQTKTPGI